jgi:hypothetical protein
VVVRMSDDAGEPDRVFSISVGLKPGVHTSI